MTTQTLDTKIKSKLREKVEEECFILQNSNELSVAWTLRSGIIIPLSKVRNTLTLYTISDNNFDDFIKSIENPNLAIQYSSEFEVMFSPGEHKQKSVMYLGERTTLIFNSNREECYYKFFISDVNKVFWFSSLGTRLMLQQALQTSI